MVTYVERASVSLRDVAVELTQEECSTWACSEEPVKDVKLEKYIRLISKASPAWPAVPVGAAQHLQEAKHGAGSWSTEQNSGTNFRLTLG
ncbi:uncharacterized protein LOC143672863 isoform X3 [Tamandua tetradactyla]|uniref:uncharacterized protein LOC143672863 isoform X3 n=1 Tax=Tamandua tetradactyla TaxID=48850 RepID=UPI004053A5B7